MKAIDYIRTRLKNTNNNGIKRHSKGIATDENSGTRDVMFACPVSPIAFPDLMDEPVHLTQGEGTWGPVAIATGEDWRMPVWAEASKPLANKLISGEATAGEICHGCQWYINRAMAVLEYSHTDDEANDDSNRLYRMLHHVGQHTNRKVSNDSKSDLQAQKNR